MARRDFFNLLTRQSLKNYIEPYLFDKQQVYAQNCNVFMHIITMVN